MQAPLDTEKCYAKLLRVALATPLTGFDANGAAETAPAMASFFASCHTLSSLATFRNLRNLLTSSEHSM
jgi:hypothetical protein